MSPFACKLLDEVTVLPFFQLTLYLTDNTRDRSNKQIIAVFSLVVIYQKSPAENAGDCISKTLIFKNFLGEHAPRLPYIFFPCVHHLNLCPWNDMVVVRGNFSITAREVASATSCS